MPKPKEVHIVLPADLHAALSARAKREQRSLGAEARYGLLRYLEQIAEPTVTAEAVTSD